MQQCLVYGPCLINNCNATTFLVQPLVIMSIALVLSYLVTALLLFILWTILLATFGWSLGVRRLYVRVLLKIFKVKLKQILKVPCYQTFSTVQYARHVSSKHLKQKRNDFIIGAEPETEESEVEDDGDSGRAYHVISLTISKWQGSLIERG